MQGKNRPTPHELCGGVVAIFVEIHGGLMYRHAARAAGGIGRRIAVPSGVNGSGCELHVIVGG